MDNGFRFPSRGRALAATGGRGGLGPGACAPSKPVGGRGRQIRPGVQPREASVREGLRPEPWGLRPDRREKPLARTTAPVPQTDTGGRVEQTKVGGRPSVKELGKLAP